MADAADDNVTRLLHRWTAGDSDALDRLLPLIYSDLRRMAAGVERVYRAALIVMRGSDVGRADGG